MPNAGDNLPDGTWLGDPDAPWNVDQADGRDSVGIRPLGDNSARFELTNVERLAVAQALYNAIGSLVSTKKDGSLRSRVESDMRASYEVMRMAGVAPKSFDINLLGEKVGTYSITTSDAEPAREETVLDVESKAALLDWAAHNGCATVDMGKVQGWFASTGEVPPGCAARVIRVAPKQAGIKRTALRVDPEKVSQVLGQELLGREVAAMLAEGGE